MHYDILTSDLIQRAAQLARSLGHSYVGSAHLLLVMAREPGAVGQTLRLLGMDPDLTEAMARLLYGQGTPELPLPQGLTGESRELLRGAAREAKHLGSREITPQHLLLAMARRENSDAYELLKLNGISTDELFTHAVDYLHWEQGAPVRGKKEAVTTKLLEQFSEDLILKASGMDPVIGREREIDTVIGKKDENEPCVLTLVERMTRMCIWVKAKNHTAEAITKALQQIMSQFADRKDQVFKTITGDNGSEFAGLSLFENGSLKVYFTHPYSSFEKGTNECHNHMLRRFIPKGKSISDYAAEDVCFFADCINGLPRKILGYKTPEELFDYNLDRIYAA